MAIYKKDDVINYNDGEIRILDLLGEGGQGEVYLVSYNNQQLAFKYYKEIQSDDFKYNLKNNIAKGSPSPSFLWPKEYIEFEGGECGYLMDLRPNNYVSFVSLMNAKTRFKNKKVFLDWCIELVKSFKLLHEMGYSYQDLNDGSFFLDPDTGKLLICDNDNVTANKCNLGILGKMKYMAPEIVIRAIDPLTGEAQMPDVHSDRFSLAIILFMSFCLGYPFEGEHLKNYDMVDEKAEYEMFGSNPVYIYSNVDTSNRPIRGYHTAILNRYPGLPSYIKDAFHRTFVDGLVDRENERTTEIEWLKLLCRYRDELYTCSCGNEFHLQLFEKNKVTTCPRCKSPVREHCYLIVGKNKIVLEPNKYLYKSHIDKYSSDYSSSVGKVIVNKNNPSLWGIKLQLDQEVMIKDSKGNEKVVQGDGVIPIISNLKIKFTDSVIGQIIKE